ncbi:thioredoxin family protein [Sedimenticola hydrogenitrophicus]|uniref:thioredoxin family protein n=1 Tax=Sedimenticola hydrogenitrophicus TaxID=2967975 RepID=UPI0021A4D02B|nr:thioredoxin fold domain-containing protein [Sedimenticola hydrogenitrophicus]
MKYLTALFAVLLFIAPLHADDDREHAALASVTVATNLQADGEIARKGRKALLLLVSREECSYCIQIKREVIGPMLRSGDYDDRLLIRELRLDGVSTVIDFQGVARDSHNVAYDYKASVTPTLLFLDADGKELTAKMVGIQTPDMYYYYVDQSIQEAIEALDSRTEQ